MGMGRVVAEGNFSSSDPSSLVHHIPIGPNAVRVWVDVPKERNAYLWRTTSDMTYIEDAVGTTIAWPVAKLLWTLFQSNVNWFKKKIGTSSLFVKDGLEMSYFCQSWLELRT